MRARTTQLPVPGWADKIAHLIPLLAVPSGLWRLGIALGFSMGVLDEAGRPAHMQGFEALSIASLTLITELVALTAFGLVRRWGEVAPSWIPLIGGRQVAPYAAIIPATLGSLALITLWTFTIFGLGDMSFSHTWMFVAMVACYAPLHLWGPLLLVLTWAYYKRRSAEVSVTASPGLA
jgi:hypothetical protein